MFKEDSATVAAPTEMAGPGDQIAAALREIVGAKRYEAWVHPGVTFDVSTPNTVRVSVGSSLERDCLAKHLKADIRRACVQAGCGKRRVEFAVQSGAPRDKNPPAVAAEPRPVDQRDAPTPQGLRQVIASASNREALTLAALIADGHATPSPAVLWGPSGCGKTRLLNALRDEIRRRNRRMRVVQLTAEDFTSGFVSAIQSRTLPTFRGRHRGVDLLLIDDVHFLLGKQKTLEELQYTLDALHNQGAAVVLTSDRGPAELRRISGDLLARLGAGVSVEINSPDLELKRKLVERFAAELSLPLEEDASRAVAGGVMGGAWELRGVVNKLHLMSQLVGQSLEAVTVQRVIEDINRISTPPLKIGDIQRAVCELFGVDVTVIKSSKRTRSVTEPRMLAMWLARKYTQAAWSEIGDQFGRRSHSTVISACRRVDDLMQRSASVHVPGGAYGMQEAVRLVEQRLRTA